MKYSVSIPARDQPAAEYLVEASSKEDAEYEAIDKYEREHPLDFCTNTREVQA
jgi:hypothetical protein